MVGTRHILGLAIDDAGVVATELSIQSGRTEIRRTGELLWGQELTADSVGPLGQQLRQFLREQGFSAKRAVVGLAAKWVLTKEVDAPPASADALASMLSIQAERAFSMDADDLIFDYCGRTSTSEKSPILLLAARRQIVHQIREMMDAAGLQVQAITLSALACGKALSQGNPASWYGVYARPTYCEFWAQLDGSPRFIKHVPMGKNGTPAGYVEMLASTIERLVLLSPAPGPLPPHPTATYDACGLSDEVIDGLGKRLGSQIRVSNGRAGLLSKGLGLQDHPDEARAIAAAAVAMTVVGPQKPPVDFLHPRVGGKKVVSHKRALVWGAGVAAAGVLGLGVLLAIWHSYRSDIAASNAWLKENEAQITAAQEAVDRYKYRRSWDSREPQFLECLKGLTTAFPEEPYLWASSLALNENGTGSVVGKTTSETSFYEMLDKIKQDAKEFPDVKMMYLRDPGRDSREKEFAINFQFKFQGAK
jgi:hypothetical protein